MKHTQRRLMTIFIASLAVGIAIVTLFETDVLPCGFMVAEDKSGEFVAAVVMELLTIAVIPAALRLFRFKRIADQLVSPEALAKWGTLRLLMLCVPMIANTLIYYMFMNVAFGYMGIILMLCLVFVVPTGERCRSEIKKQS